jgi:hypothetical protein
MPRNDPFVDCLIDSPTITRELMAEELRLCREHNAELRETSSMLKGEVNDLCYQLRMVLTLFRDGSLLGKIEESQRERALSIVARADEVERTCW